MPYRPLEIFRLEDGQWIGYGETPTPPPDPDPDPTTGDFVSASSAVEGGGFQNAIAVSPFTTGGHRPYLIGADVAGAHRSIDQGATWVPCNIGSLGSSARVAAIMWSDTVPGRVFLAEDNGIHMSSDYGQTWARRAAGTAVDWDANNAGGAPEHPRQTGYMLAQDNSTATKHVWAGTRTKGLRRSVDNFATFAATVMAGYPIRSIALDPNDRNVLYVAVNRGTAAQNGMWKVTNARGAMTPTKMTGYPGRVASPVGPEEVLAVDVAGATQVYVAGHESGMFRYTPSSNTWQAINGGLALGGPVYRAIAVDPTNPRILYCGNWHPSNRRAVWRSSNGGDSWVPISNPTAGSIVVDWDMFGTSTRSWLADIPYHSFAGPNSDWLPAMIAIDPDVTNRVLIAGRGGAWVGTLTGAVRTWQPATRGLMVTVCMAVAVDELVDGRALMGNMDYTALYDEDAFAGAIQSKSPSAASTGDSVCFDMAVTSGRGRAYVGASQRGQNTGVGKIFSSDTPERGTGTHWVDEVGGAFNADVPALAVGKNSAGTRVILAGVSNAAGSSQGGLWRKVGSSWTQFRAAGSNPFGLSGTGAASNMGCIRFRRNSAVVYALDNDGLWRSNDAGATWVRILGGVSAVYGTYDALVLDPTDTAKLYVSSGGTVRRVNNASTSSGTGATTTTTIWTGNAGNIAVRADGAEMFINIRDGRLMHSTAFKTAASQAAASWVDIADNLFRRNSGNIRSLAVTPGGIVLTADNGSGALRGERVA
jgi:hypothetical protein